jgi:uncharacterized protein (TIGR03067 family)
MRITRRTWLIAFSTLLAGCSGAPASTAADEKAWQGTWKLVDATYDGEPQPGDMAWVVDGDRYRIRLDGQLHVDTQTFRLDAGRKTIDVFHHETPPGTFGGSLKGIYAISGDALAVCYDLTGQAYPAAFEAPRGSRRVLYHFRRE